MAAKEAAFREVPAPSRIGALRGRWARVEAGAAGKYWSQLTAVEFLNSSFAFAALAVLCAFPFLAIAAAATGGDFRRQSSHAWA